MLELGVLADDLTGGMMVASLLEREGVRCPLVTSTDALNGLDPNAEAVVVGRKIRLIPAQDACADAVNSARALRALDTKRIFYKYCATFDSTDKGNIGPIAEALMAELDADRTLFCPAFPEYSVTIFQGRMFLGSTMLGESGKRFDPVTPMTNSNLIEVLDAQSQAGVGLISHGLLSKTPDEIESNLRQQIERGKPLFVVDAVDDDDVTRIAEMATGWPLTTGADALPMFLARTWMNQEGEVPQRRLLPPSPGGEAVIAGSCAEATRKQVEFFEQKHPVYRIDLTRADDSTVAQVTAWAKQHIADGPVAVSTSADVEGVEAAQKIHGREGAAALADRLLGECAVALRDMGVTKFVVAGGETSGQVFGSLGVGQVQVSSFDELSGGYCHETGDKPRSFVLKAGALGNEQFFFTALERMREADAQG